VKSEVELLEIGDLIEILRELFGLGLDSSDATLARVKELRREAVPAFAPAPNNRSARYDVGDAGLIVLAFAFLDGGMATRKAALLVSGKRATCLQALAAPFRSECKRSKDGLLTYAGTGLNNLRSRSAGSSDEDLRIAAPRQSFAKLFDETRTRHVGARDGAAPPSPSPNSNLRPPTTALLTIDTWMLSQRFVDAYATRSRRLRSDVVKELVRSSSL
jgi:hypothetical protein